MNKKIVQFPLCFVIACRMAGIPHTTRQFRRWNQKEGAAWLAWIGVIESPETFDNCLPSTR
jgi:hypothetical protein